MFKMPSMTFWAALLARKSRIVFIQAYRVYYAISHVSNKFACTALSRCYWSISWLIFPFYLLDKHFKSNAGKVCKRRDPISMSKSMKSLESKIRIVSSTMYKCFLFPCLSMQWFIMFIIVSLCAGRFLFTV